MVGWQLYLTGEVQALSARGRAGQRDLHGPQGRILLACLALSDGPVPAAELAERIWDGREPGAWEGALRVVVHRVRSALRPVIRREDPIPSEGGCYRLDTAAAWIDVRAARALLQHAEDRFHAGSGAAGGLAHAAACIARRPFLPGAEGHWVEHERLRLTELRIRALCCLAECWLERSAAAGAGAAREAFSLDPASTRAALVLARAQLAESERAHALRTIDAHRAAIAELGLEAAPELLALRRRIRGAGRGAPTPVQRGADII